MSKPDGPASAWPDPNGMAGRKDVRAVRAHNERRLRFERANGDASPIPLVCECADAYCFGAVLASRSTTRRVYARTGRYLVRPGHLSSDLDVVLERLEACWIVAQPEASGRAGPRAPRSGKPAEALTLASAIDRHNPPAGS